MAVRPEGTNHQRRKILPGEVSIDPVANELCEDARWWPVSASGPFWTGKVSNALPGLWLGHAELVKARRYRGYRCLYIPGPKSRCQAWQRPWSPGGVRLGRGYEHGTVF